MGCLNLWFASSSVQQIANSCIMQAEQWKNVQFYHLQTEYFFHTIKQEEQYSKLWSVDGVISQDQRSISRNQLKFSRDQLLHF